MSDVADTIAKSIGAAPLEQPGDMDKLTAEIDAVNTAMAAALRQQLDNMNGKPVSDGFRQFLDERANAYASLAGDKTAREMDQQEHQIHKPG
jgi:hypothetical protein